MLDAKILLLALSMLTNIKSTKLSNQKKCGDPECVSKYKGLYFKSIFF